MKEQLPDYFTLQYTAEAIDGAITRLAKDIGEWAVEVREQQGQDLLLVPVMRGALYFAADLSRKIPTSVAVEPISTSSYSSSENATPHLDVKVDFQKAEVKDASVLILDDICDSGRTLAVLSEKLHLAGVKEVRACVLIHREIENPLYKPAYYGFNYVGPEWFVGYGLEDKNRWRNLGDIYKIAPGA